MAKPKRPLLSLGARGSIGDTLTFQKRGRLTIARQKPIPTDPQTDLQLAQRQVYRDAVAAWNALTPEEKEAYRGICPGLTPYQCYMKTALAYVEPEPPPEEYTEEQTQHNTEFQVRDIYPRTAQRLIIPAGRSITKLGFWLRKEGVPTGEVYFRIRRVSDDGIELEKLWGDASALLATHAYEEVAFDTPKVLTDEHRLCVEFSGGSTSHYVVVAKQDSDVKENEYHTYYNSGAWIPLVTSDLAYRYKYYEVE